MNFISKNDICPVNVWIKIEPINLPEPSQKPVAYTISRGWNATLLERWRKGVFRSRGGGIDRVVVCAEIIDDLASEQTTVRWVLQFVGVKDDVLGAEVSDRQDKSGDTENVLTLQRPLFVDARRKQTALENRDPKFAENGHHPEYPTTSLHRPGWKRTLS